MLREIDRDRAQFALLKADQRSQFRCACALNHLAMVDLRGKERDRRRNPAVETQIYAGVQILASQLGYRNEHVHSCVRKSPTSFALGNSPSLPSIHFGI